LEKLYKIENSKSISIVCFNATVIPFVILEQTAKVSLDNLTSPDPIQNLRQLYSNVSSLNIPKSWGNVDIQNFIIELEQVKNPFIMV